MKNTRNHILKIICTTIAFFVLVLDSIAQKTVVLETDRKITITIPKGYDILPTKKTKDGPYKQAIHLRLEAIYPNQENLLWIYTIELSMPKEGKELNDEIKNVKNTDSYVFPELKSTTLVEQDHSKWYQWSEEWSKKLYTTPEATWHYATFVSQTATHMIVLLFEFKDFKDMEEFEGIIKSIEYKKSFFDSFEIFLNNHEFWATIFFVVLFSFVGIAIDIGREHDTKSFILALLCFLLLMGWLLFAFKGDWKLVGTTILISGLVIYVGVKIIK